MPALAQEHGPVEIGRLAHMSPTRFVGFRLAWLGLSLMARASDRDEAITITRKAVESNPQDDPNHPAYVTNLALAL